MDEPRSVNERDKRHWLLALTNCLLFFLLLFSACASSEPKSAPPAARETFSEIVKSVVQTRGLAPKQEITLAPSGGKAPALAASDRYGGAPLAQIEEVYKSVGLLPASSDFRKDLREFRVLEQLTSYDAAKSTVSWSAQASAVAAALVKTDADKARNLAPVLAILQALQEQHFRWRVVVDGVALEDRRSAFRAVALGDALLTLAARGTETDDRQLWAATRQFGTQAAIAMDRLANTLPIFLRRQLTFPYRAGSEFVYWAFRSRGWQGINALYANPPLSSAEILHPEKYFIEREAPLRFFPPHLLRRFKAAVVEQSLGEDAMVGILARQQSLKAAGEIGAAWRGDQLFAFPENAGLTTVWFSSWETEAQAQRFLRAYRGVLQAEHGVRFAAPPGERGAAMAARGRDRGAWLLQRSASVVLLVSASEANRLSEIAAEAWKDLEIDKEALDVRFESARAQINSR